MRGVSLCVYGEFDRLIGIIHEFLKKIQMKMRAVFLTLDQYAMQSTDVLMTCESDLIPSRD